MEILNRFYELLGLNTPDTPMYVKIMVPVVFAVTAIVFTLYIYNFVKNIAKGTKSLVKCTVNITSGLMSVARGIRISKDQTLTDSQIRRIAIGALYAYQQGGYVDALKMDINPIRLNTVLGDWWGINNREDALNTLQYLSQGAYSIVFPAIYKAFTTVGVLNQKTIITESTGVDDELCTATWDKLKNLKRSYDGLVANGIVKDKDDMERIGVMGWDAGRLNFIARACLEKGYISEQECWQYIDRADDMAHISTHSWRDFANSYMLGRALWNGETNMSALAEDLLSKPESPWVMLKW